MVEDIECNYWKKGERIYGYELSGYSNLDFFRSLQGKINAPFSKIKNDIDISTMTFAQNCIIITKSYKQERIFHERKYAWEDRLKNT